ncbi:MAG: FAD-dependent oxidoreductase [Longimicrobiales bacterium]
MALETLTVQCCVVGGGPAGVMLGYLLARAGVDVVVLEKHDDFFRDFRGDTIHPSTLELMRELGVLEAFLRLPHQHATTVGVRFGEFEATVADFTHLPTHCKFLALMPQWDFLDFLARLGTRYRTFALRMGTEATGIIEDDGRVAGVRAETAGGPLEIRADLVGAADGRHSTIRKAAGFEVDVLGAPMDVLWFRLPREPADPRRLTFFIASGCLLIMIDRGDYWQMGYVIPKDGLEALKAAGMELFCRALTHTAPFLGARTAALRSWDEVKLLSVRVDRLRRWFRPGLLCIGDAAHAMSPVGGVGVNLAVQDAVATANILADALKHGGATPNHLAAVQRRRAFPARVTQKVQVAIQDTIIGPLLASTGPLKPPLAIRLLHRIPLLQRLPARFIGIGARPEHVTGAEDAAARVTS